MNTRNRLMILRDAIAEIVASPRVILRLAASIRRRDGNGIALSLRERVDSTVRREATVGMLAEESLVIEFIRDGLRWRVDIGDEIGGQLFAKGRYEGDEIDATLRWLRSRRPDGVVVDVGANVGTTSVPFALAGYSVIAIEPVPETFDMLWTNVERNRLGDRITCVQAAISDRPGEVEMWTGFGSGQSEIAVAGRMPALTRWGEAHELIRVVAGPLSAMLANRGTRPVDIALVWADVQGAETSVILTGIDLWANGVPLYLEVDPTSLDLHAGLDAFLIAARDHFDSFITRDDLIAGRPAEAIDYFASWVATIGPTSFSDALLIPRHGPTVE